MNKQGLIHLYYGDGKGKTTAAMGLAVRAAGADMNVLLVQFLKAQNTSELKSLAQIPKITVTGGNPSGKFTFQMDAQEREQSRQLHHALLQQAIATAQAGRCDLLILDELLGALSTQLVDEQAVKDLVAYKPPQLELVITGRNPPEWLISAADYASEICCRKHPYEQGIGARKGIEL